MMITAGTPLPRWVRRGVPWAGAFFIAAIVASAAWDIVRSHEAAVAETARDLQTQARVIAEQTARSIQAADVVLRHIAEQHDRGALAGFDERALHDYLRDQSVGLVQIDGLLLVDADGRVRASSIRHPLPPDTPSVSDHPGFRALRADPARGLVVGGAVLSNVDGQWVFPFGRRLQGPRGAFAGAVAARGRVDYFQDFYRDVAAGGATKTTLLHRDGTLLARHPPMPGALGQPFALLDAVAAERPRGGGEAAVRFRSPIDGVTRFGAVRAVPDYPLDIVVTRDADDALAPWRAQALGTALRTLALSLLAALLLALLMRQLARLHRVSRSLELQKNRFALAVAGSNDGIWDWDQGSRMVFASARTRELLGLPPGPEMVTMDEWFASLPLHPEDAPLREQAMQDHLAGRTPLYECEYRVRHRDSEYRWVRVRGLCVRDEQGQPLRMAGSVSDIDARKRVEEALRESEQRYRIAMTGSNEGHWVWNIADDRVFASASLYRLLGLPEDQPLATRAEFFRRVPIQPDDLARLARAIDEHLAGQRPYVEIDYRVTLPDGSTRWVHSRGQCFRDAEGRPQQMAGATVDITERKRAEEALRQSEERYALAVAGSDDGVWDWDFRTGMAFESARARELQGLPPGPELQPLPALVDSLRVHPEDAPRREEGIRAHLAGETPAYECEYRVRHGEDHYRWIRVRALCIRDEQGKPVRMAGSVTDIDARRRAEDALRVSEERFALAMTGSTGGHWVWETRTDALFVSGTVNQLFGLPPDYQPTTRREYFEHVPVHPDDKARLRQIEHEVRHGGVTRLDYEHRIVLPGGEPRWILTRAQCFRDDAGQALRVAGVSVDITERKRTEEALRQSEERFALAVAGTDDGILDWDIVADRMYVSPRALAIVGLPEDSEVRSQHDWEVLVMPRFHPDDARRLAEQLGGPPESVECGHDGEYRVRGRDGGWRWARFRGRSIVDGSGRAVRWAGSISDIDARKRTEEALRRSEERYQLAVLGSSEGLWDWDLAADTLFLSARAQQLLWREIGEPLQPRHLWIDRTAYHPDDVPRIREALKAHLAGRSEHFEVQYRVQVGEEWRWFRQRGVAIRDADGRPYRMAGSMEDITERKRDEAQRERLEQQLRQSQKLEAMGTLAGGIAHDFNNILAAILGYGEMALKDAAAGSTQRRHLEAAMSAGMRAKSLVERILAFSRSGMGERVPVHVASVVGEALDAVAGSLPAGIVLERAIGGGDTAVLGDPTQIHQVVMNLCANAVQAMGHKGTLAARLDAAAVPAARSVTTGELAAGTYLRLEVRDSGVGIPPNVLERIFDPFFTTKEVGVGTGLGLSLVHGIVTDLGGGIEVQSTLGAGTTLVVWLPSCGETAPPLAADDAGAGDGGRGETVLLVDDERALVRLGEEMLAELGYEPVGFESSIEALRSLREDPQRYDLVLSDESMPELTGSELAREIRKLRPDIPIVLMTGHVSPTLAARAKSLGIEQVLGKPLVSREIARALAAALERSASEAVAART